MNCVNVIRNRVYMSGNDVIVKEHNEAVKLEKTAVSVALSVLKEKPVSIAVKNDQVDDQLKSVALSAFNHIFK